MQIVSDVIFLDIPIDLYEEVAFIRSQCSICRNLIAEYVA